MPLGSKRKRKKYIMTDTPNPTNKQTIPAVSITTAHTGASQKPNSMGTLTYFLTGSIATQSIAMGL